MKAPVIQTKTYTLRPFKESDVELWQIWDVDPEVQAYMPEPLNVAVDTQEHLKYINECEDEEDGYYWSIDTSTGITIGTVALTDINNHHKLADLGIVIGDKTYWGKGIATGVILALVHHAFTELGIERISAEVEVGNIGAQKVFEGAGFEQDGEFKSARVKNGHRIDVLHFGIIKHN